MKKFITLLAALLIAVSQGAIAQRTITGKAINGEDGLPMPGVYVSVKGTTIVTQTNTAGNFSLTVPNNRAIIVMSFVGFKTVELLVGTNTQFNFTLQPDPITLGNVVVTADRNQRQRTIAAMGIERDIKTLPYAITHFFAEEFRTGDMTDLGRALNGRVPGLTLIQDGQGAGVNTIILFRGQGLPLYVIDGIPLSRGEGGYTDISWLDLEMIETIAVLRGYAAGSIYGVAASAVISITLKK